MKKYLVLSVLLSACAMQAMERGRNPYPPRFGYPNPQYQEQKKEDEKRDLDQGADAQRVKEQKQDAAQLAAKIEVVKKSDAASPVSQKDDDRAQIFKKNKLKKNDKNREDGDGDRRGGRMSVLLRDDYMLKETRDTCVVQ